MQQLKYNGVTTTTCQTHRRWHCYVTIATLRRARRVRDDLIIRWTGPDSWTCPNDGDAAGRATTLRFRPSVASDARRRPTRRRLPSVRRTAPSRSRPCGRRPARGRGSARRRRLRQRRPELRSRQTSPDGRPVWWLRRPPGESDCVGVVGIPIWNGKSASTSVSVTSSLFRSAVRSGIPIWNDHVRRWTPRRRMSTAVNSL